MPSNNDFPVLSSFMTYHRVCNTKGVTSGAGTANPSGEPDFTPVFSGVGVTRSLVFCVMFCRSLFVLLSLFIWSFVVCRILITPLISHFIGTTKRRLLLLRTFNKETNKYNSNNVQRELTLTHHPSHKIKFPKV